MISVMYAPVFNESVMAPATNGLNVSPGNSCGMAKNTKNACTRIGVPRNT